MSENGEIYTGGKNFTLPPAVTAWTNLTSDPGERRSYSQFVDVVTVADAYAEKHVDDNWCRLGHRAKFFRL